MLRRETPTEKLATLTPSELRLVADREKAAFDRAQARKTLARMAASYPGSLTEKKHMLGAAVAAGQLPLSRPPSRETIRKYEQKWLNGERDIRCYYDEPRSGRPRKRLFSGFEEIIRDAVKSGKQPNVKNVYERIRLLAEQADLEPPSYDLVKRRFGEYTRAERAGSRHGSLAAELDGMPSGRVCSRYSNDTWAIDELMLPVYFGWYHDVWNRWVSVLADVVLIVDVASTAIISYLVTFPPRRRDDEGLPLLSGMDSDDVLAALLSAASPELAPDATRDLAGYLPDRIRWDNHKVHKTLATWIKDKTDIPINLIFTRKKRPSSNAAVERRVGILKPWCAGVRGHIDDVIPTDRMHNDFNAYHDQARTEIAGTTGERETRKEPIHPSQLPSYEEVCAAFDKIVSRYNYRHRNRMSGTTAAANYFNKRKPRRPRNGENLVMALEPKVKLVTRDGIIHSSHGTTQVYPTIVGGAMLLVDAPVTYRADPLNRGIFLEFGEESHFLRPVGGEYNPKAAAELAKQKSITASRISKESKEHRRAAFESEVGPGTHAEAQEAKGRAVKRLEAYKNDEPLPPHMDSARPPVAPTEPPSSPESLEEEGAETPSPWSSRRPDAFLRPDRGGD